MAAYAGWMDAPNQVPEPERAAPGAPSPPVPDVAGDDGTISPFPPIPEVTGRVRRGLVVWLVLVATAGLTGLVFNQLELALFTAMAGLFVVAHAADQDSAHLLLYQLVAWAVPVLGFMVFAGMGLAMMLPASWSPTGSALDLTVAARIVGLATTWAGALLVAAMAFPPVGHMVARWWFNAPVTSHVLRLAARLSMVGMLMYVPAAVLFQGMIEGLMETNQPLIGQGSLWGNLIGLTLLGLGGVGFGIRRDLRETLDRLGLRPVSAAQWLVVGLGVAALMLLNGGSEWVQRTWFPALAQHDHQVTEMITRGLGPADVLLLGISAGVGEELAIRGALQPKLGIARAAALFALLHVQYSWFGIAVIFGLGLILGAIRARTSTTVAILVHTLYDIVAVILAKP